MKKCIILSILFVSIATSLFAGPSQRKFLDRLHCDVGFAYAPTLSFDKEDEVLTTAYSNSFIINNEITMEGSKVGLNVGVYGCFPYMTQVTEKKQIINTPTQGISQLGIISVSLAPTLTIFKNDLSKILIALGPKISTEFNMTQKQVDLTSNVGIELDAMARVLGNDNVNFLIGVKQSFNFYRFGSHATVNNKETFKGAKTSYEVLPYIGINLHI